MGVTAPDGEPLLGNAFQKEFAGEGNARTLSFDERATRATVHRNKRPGGVPGQSWRIKGIFEAWQFMVNAGLMTGSHVTKDCPPGMLGGFFALPACDGTEPPASPRKERNTFLKIV